MTASSSSFRLPLLLSRSLLLLLLLLPIVSSSRDFPLSALSSERSLRHGLYPARVYAPTLWANHSVLLVSTSPLAPSSLGLHPHVRQPLASSSASSGRSGNGDGSRGERTVIVARVSTNTAPTKVHWAVALPAPRRGVSSTLDAWANTYLLVRDVGPEVVLLAKITAQGGVKWRRYYDPKYTALDLLPRPKTLSWTAPGLIILPAAVPGAKAVVINAYTGRSPRRLDLLEPHSSSKDNPLHPGLQRQRGLHRWNIIGQSSNDHDMGTFMEKPVTCFLLLSNARLFVTCGVANNAKGSFGEVSMTNVIALNADDAPSITIFFQYAFISVVKTTSNTTVDCDLQFTVAYERAESFDWHSRNPESSHDLVLHSLCVDHKTFNLQHLGRRVHHLVKQQGAGGPTLAIAGMRRNILLAHAQANIKQREPGQAWLIIDGGEKDGGVTWRKLENTVYDPNEDLEKERDLVDFDVKTDPYGSVTHVHLAGVQVRNRTGDVGDGMVVVTEKL